MRLKNVALLVLGFSAVVTASDYVRAWTLQHELGVALGSTLQRAKLLDENVAFERVEGLAAEADIDLDPDSIELWDDERAHETHLRASFTRPVRILFRPVDKTFTAQRSVPRLD
ncbi:MAG: hypothetical protein AAF533_22395 [Acidobacteriota bacterium]